MSRSLKRFVIALTLGVISAFVLGTPAVLACTARCVKVAEPFCRRCLDVGEYTGITCMDSGSCGCFFTQNTCGLAANGIREETSLADLGLLLETLQCPALSATTGAETAPLLAN